MRLTSAKRNRERSVELSMTSMIDVVFLLLIYFIVTLSFVKTERQLDSAIETRRQTAKSAGAMEPAIIEIRLAGGRWIFRLGSLDFTQQDALTDTLRRFPNKEDGAFVRVPDGAPFRYPAAAIQAAKSAGFVNVVYVPDRSN